MQDELFLLVVHRLNQRIVHGYPHGPVVVKKRIYWHWNLLIHGVGLEWELATCACAQMYHGVCVVCA